MEKKYKRTLYACYFGYITQAAIVNLVPLLFVIFQKTYHLTVTQIGFLVTFNFAIQILTDLVAIKYVEKIGPKPCAILANVLSAVGLAGLSVLPEILPVPYMGLLICVGIYAIGGGLLEVLISPIVEALPTTGKSSAMSLLHSFYSWGQAAVVLLTTAFFWAAGQDDWRILPLLWAVIPLGNIFLFLISPVSLPNENAESISTKALFRMKLFWLLALLMLCSSAAEQAMSQWASFFAEKGLRVSKTTGDLLGPMTFALLMGVARMFYGIKGEKIQLEKFIVVSGILCIGSYLLVVFSPIPVLSLVGCGLCGLSVGIMWPGVISLASARCPRGGTAMFAFLALAGDVGCSAGPSVVSIITEASGGQMKAGLLAAIVFPVILALGIRRLRRSK